MLKNLTQYHEIYFQQEKDDILIEVALQYNGTFTENIEEESESNGKIDNDDDVNIQTIEEMTTSNVEEEETSAGVSMEEKKPQLSSFDVFLLKTEVKMIF